MIIWHSNLKLRLNNTKNVYLTGQIKVKWKEISRLLSAAPLGVTPTSFTTSKNLFCCFFLAPSSTSKPSQRLLSATLSPNRSTWAVKILKCSAPAQPPWSLFIVHSPLWRSLNALLKCTTAHKVLPLGLNRALLGNVCLFGCCARTQGCETYGPGAWIDSGPIKVGELYLFANPAIFTHTIP